MISPDRYCDAVSSVRFLALTTADDSKQITMMEVTVEKQTDQQFELRVFRSGSAPVGISDASGLMEIMGGQSTVDDAFDCWDNRNHTTTAPRTVARLSDSHVLTIPQGPCIVSTAWMHDVVVHNMTKEKCVYLPTYNDVMPSWRMEAIVVNADASPYGKPPARPLSRSLRWDLAMQRGGVCLCGLDRAHAIKQRSASLPFHDLYFQIKPKNVPMDRTYMGVSGAVMRDETALKLVSACEVGFMLVPVICGCFVRDALNFKKAHVPLTITERMTRASGPLVFRDAEGAKGTIDVVVGHRATFEIDLLDREMFGGLCWLCIRPKRNEENSSQN